jgi:hypothetical protein
MARRALLVTLSESDRRELERWVSAHRTPQQVVQRCRIVVAAAKGQQDKDIAESMEINVKTVALWRQRFSREGPDCLWEVAAGRGRRPWLTPDKVEEIINATLQTKIHHLPLRGPLSGPRRDGVTQMSLENRNQNSRLVDSSPILTGVRLSQRQFWIKPSLRS